MKNVIVIDTETADLMSKSNLTLDDAKNLGYNSLDEIPICFQLSYIIDNGSRKQIRDALGKPAINISVSSSEVTNMVQSELEKLTKKEDGSFIKINETSEFKELKTLIEKTNKEDLYLVIHNAEFDVDVLKREGLDISNCKLIDTLQLSKFFDKDLEFHRLHYLLYAKEDIYQIVKNIVSSEKIESISKIKPLTPHNSLYDVFVTNSLFQEYRSLALEMNGVTEDNVLDKLHEISITPFEMKTVPFGINKGKDIKDLDTSAILWFMKNNITEINFKYSLNKELDNRGGIEHIISKLSDFEVNKLLNNIENEEFKTLLENKNNVIDENKIVTLGFGKYKDTDIKLVDESYLSWLKTNNSNQTIISIIDKELSRRKENSNSIDEVKTALSSNSLEDFLNS